MCKKLVYVVCAAMVLTLASTSFAEVVKIGNFESGFDGWYVDQWVDGTLTLGATGATVGAQALQIDAPVGGWHSLTKVNVKPYMATLAQKGVKVTADVTAFEADMTTPWMQLRTLINAQSNDDAGANNNLGRVEIGSQDINRDGQSHTYTWVLPDTLTAKIAGADDRIGWFEIELISNVDPNSVVKFYIDNIQIVYEPPPSVVVIGDFENGSLDNWSKAFETTPVELANATVGATSGSSSLSLTTTDGYWCLQWNAPAVPATLKDRKLQFDLTMIASEWPVARWTKVADKVALNSDGASGWKDYNNTAVVVDKATGASTSLDWGRWWDTAPDVVKTYTIDVSDYDVTGATWFQIVISVQGGDGQAHFYFDNIRLVGPAKSTAKSTDTVIGNWEQQMDGWTNGATANLDIRYNDVNGVTLDKYSLDIFHTDSGWQEVLKLNAVDSNLVDAIRQNQQISVDVTRLVADWPGDKAPEWGGLHMAFNCGGEGWSLWQEFGYAGNWVPSNGDQTQAVVWNYAPYLSQIDFGKVGWFEILFFSNYDDNYTGGVLLYLDNMKLIGGGRTINPQPADGAKDVDTETLLRWDAGMFATSYNVYLGASAGAVASADGNSNPDVTFVQLDGTSFDPNGLQFNTMYYWRVDAVNDVNPDSPWKGPVWNFTTANAIVVDDFETYTDNSEAGEAIFQAWADGWTDEVYGGSQVGNTNRPYAERTTVHGGSQAMPLTYDNTKFRVSEAMRTWADPQDWTRNSYNTMKLYVWGNVNNLVDTLYVIVEDSAGTTATVKSTDTTIMTTEAWTEWQIPTSQFTDVNMTAVTKMTIGVGNPLGSPSNAFGLLLIDDIQVGAKPLGLVAWYKLEGNLDDSSGNGFNGTLAGDPNFPAKYVTGPTGFGQGMLFDGTGGGQNVELGTFNPSAATGKLTVALWAKWDGLSDQWQGLIGKRDGWSDSGSRETMMWHIEAGQTDGRLGLGNVGSSIGSGDTVLPIGVWTHIAVTFDGTTARFYVNGTETDSGSFSFGYKTDSLLQFGSDDPSGGNAFNGALDEVRIYDTPLSAAEVKALMTAK